MLWRKIKPRRGVGTGVRKYWMWFMWGRRVPLLPQRRVEWLGTGSLEGSF